MFNELATFSKPADLMAFLQRGKGAVAMALPKHLNPDRMLRLALTCFSTTPALRNCTGQSILASVVVASQLGLEPGVAGQAYLIPYGKTCTLVPGWQGLVGLLNNSGRATAWTGAVFDGDIWDFQLGSAPKCVHIPGANFGDPDKLQWVYACGKVNGSEQPVVEAWPMSRVWKHRDKFNKVGPKHYSFQHAEMYARKVVLLQVLKYMPRSIELNNAIVAADAAEIGKSSKVEEGVIVEVETIENVESPKQHSQQPKPEPQKEELKPADGEHAENAETNSAEDNLIYRQKQAEGNEQPSELPTDPSQLTAYVRGELMRRDVDEKSAVAFMKHKKHCGLKVATIGEMAAGRIAWLAENIDALVAWVNEGGDGASV